MMGKIINGLHYLTKKRDSFSIVYDKVRKKEGRILKDAEVRLLPNALMNNKNYKEWQLRKRSSIRFLDYFVHKKSNIKLLDIGCGNGWFTHLLAKSSTNNTITGIDISSIELEQAARIFKRKNLRFVYGDIFQLKHIFENQFDMITLNACVQYFPDLNNLFKVLKSFLKSQGELHIIDSPFYKTSKINQAKERSQVYYTNLAFAEMSDYYHHHKKDDIKNFKVLYKPSKNLIKRFAKKKDSPFMWLRYTKN